jgi:hypothetical protein
MPEWIAGDRESAPKGTWLWVYRRHWSGVYIVQHGRFLRMPQFIYSSTHDPDTPIPLNDYYSWITEENGPLVGMRLSHWMPAEARPEPPLWLMRALVEDFTDPDDLVWDPYSGSGTTGVACLLTGRRFLGHELQERYYDIACERLRAAEKGQALSDHRAGQVPMFAPRGGEG